MGMFLECRNEIVRALKAAGCKKEPFLSRKRMEASADSHMSGVFCENEEVERTSGKKIYLQDGKNRKRAKRYDREIIFTVVIGEYSTENAEAVYENFLRELAEGIYTDGNYVSLDPMQSDWMEDKDHILHAKVAVQMKVSCKGGLYVDTDMLKLRDVNADVGKEG